MVGSLSMDFVVRTDILPNQGETVIGESFKTFFGGKGANQAIAARRAGLDVYMFGAVGGDSFGDRLLENLLVNDIHTQGIAKLENTESGSAHIHIHQGDNRIIIVPGANDQVSIEMMKNQLEFLQEMDLIILQNEIPMATIEYLVDFAHEKKIKVLYNPAPVKKISESLIEKVDFLTPNEHEFSLMFESKDLQEILVQFPNKLIVTLGSEGAVYCDEKLQIKKISGQKVSNIIDTTGAGDTFNGFLAKGIVEGLTLSESISLANQAAALSIQKEGAQDGIPYIKDVKK